VSGLQGVGLCKVGTASLSAGGKCVGGRDSVVTGLGRMGEGGQCSGKEWIRMGRKSSWEGE
jgi:hypothetical protein